MKTPIVVGAIVGIWLGSLLMATEGLGQTDAANPGDAGRGAQLYRETYRCYACHGFTGETGNPRLNPMRLEQETFVSVVQAGIRNGQMPSYDDAPLQDLIDVYAYLRALPVDAPPIDEIPLLGDILEQVGDQE